MKRAYFVLFAAVIAAAAATALLARMPGPAPAPVGDAPEVPTTALSIAIDQGAIEPERTTVPKGHDVRLRVENRESHRVALVLAGYEDRLSLVLEPREERTVSFISDRPGADFAWLLDGEPAGRLTVSGSHLVEGHR